MRSHQEKAVLNPPTRYLVEGSGEAGDILYAANKIYADPENDEQELQFFKTYYKDFFTYHKDQDEI